jgi:hypothetical protein
MIAMGVQGIKRFGWKSWRALWWWNCILAAIYGAYAVYDGSSGGAPPSLRAAVGVAIGLLGGEAILLTPQSRPPAALPKPAGFLFQFLLVALIVEMIATGGQLLTGSVLVGVAFLAYVFILRRIDRTTDISN